MKDSLAGINKYEIDRLSDGLRINLVDEVIAAMQRATSRRGVRHADMFQVLKDIAEDTGAEESEVQGAFDEAYQNRWIMIDSDGFVKLVDSRRLRRKAIKSPLVSANLHRAGALRQLISRMAIPGWVRDRQIWKKSVASSDPSSSDFWDRVCSVYKCSGGRFIHIHDRIAELVVRPFDIHPPVWIVGEDNVLNRDISMLQAMVSEGMTPEDLETDMIAVGASKQLANRLIAIALEHPPLI